MFRKQGGSTTTGSPDAAAASGTTKVFISYSRSDADFVKWLAGALGAREDIQVFKDTEDILPSEEWRKRLEGLIAAADTIVFCLSAKSAASEVCAWEVSVAEQFNKRIIPIVLERDHGTAPGGLAKLNYIFFDKPEIFDGAFAQLNTALQTDIAWIREHSRIGELARLWEAKGKRNDLLLRGAELRDAEQWELYRPATAPLLTEGTSAYIATSKDVERKSRSARRVQATIISLLLATIVALIAVIYRETLGNLWFELTTLRSFIAQEITPFVLSEKSERNLQTGASFRECAKNCPEMIVIPSGQFLMGSPDGEMKRRKSEGPQHLVFIPDHFAVSKYEITWNDWSVCVEFRGCDSENTKDSGYGKGRRPVINVSWDQAKTYAAWLSRVTGKNYRLLTEAEWEYAARANSTSRWYFGDDDSKIDNYAWGVWNSNDKSGTNEVGKKLPNGFGLFDIHGNVLEWTEDCYADNYESTPRDGTTNVSGDCFRRVLRGGSFSEAPNELRIAYRDWYPRDGKLYRIGFRLARTLAP